MSNIPNFNVFEQQPLAATGASNAGAFSGNAAQQANDCMIINYGAVGAQVVFSPTKTPTAANTAAAAGTNQIYIPAGAVLVVNKNNWGFFAAITDTGTTSLIFHAGSGS